MERNDSCCINVVCLFVSVFSLFPLQVLYLLMPFCLVTRTEFSLLSGFIRCLATQMCRKLLETFLVYPISSFSHVCKNCLAFVRL